MYINRIELIEKVAGSIILTIVTKQGASLRLPCTFKPFLDWRHERSDKEIVAILAKYDIDVTIQDHVIVEIETKKNKLISQRNKSEPQTHKNSKARKREPQEKKDRQKLEKQRRRENQNTDSNGVPGGTHWCPYCREPVATTEHRRAGKRIYVCNKCRCTIGSS
jgi:hypothetical protein